MDVLEFRNIYWNYYIQLENDFFSYSPYCEIDQCNDNAFSVKYLQLLLSVCGEIDSICKTFCKVLDDNFDPAKAGIDDYISILREKYPTLQRKELKFWAINTGKYSLGSLSPMITLQVGGRITTPSNITATRNETEKQTTSTQTKKT